MADQFRPKIIYLCITYIPVGNATVSILPLITYIPVGNSRAITSIPRHELNYSEFQLDSPRLMQTFLR